MAVLHKTSVLKGPYFFHSSRLSPNLPDRDLRRVELYVGNVLPATVAYLRIVGQQGSGNREGDFYGYVSKSRDGVQGSLTSLSKRLSTQLVVGHFSPMENHSWLAPAPWNYAPARAFAQFA